MDTARAEMIRRGLDRWGTAASGANDEETQAAFADMVSGYLPDCELDFTRTLPDFPPSRGPEAMVRWMEGARATMDEVSFAPGELVEIGDALVVPVKVNARARNSDARIQMDVAYLFRFRGDKIAAATTYLTVEEALEAAADAP